MIPSLSQVTGRVWNAWKDASVGEDLAKTLERGVGVAVLMGGGLVVATVSVRHLASADEPLIGQLLSFGALFGVTLPLFGAVVWLLKRDLEYGRIWRVTAWSLAGTVPITTLAILIVVYQRFEGVVVAEPLTVLTWVAGGGMVGGLLTGVYDLRREDARREAERARDRLQTIVDFVPVPLVTHDANQTVTHWNPAAEQVFGYESDEILGESYPLVPEKYRDEYETHVRAAEQGETLSGVETRRQRKDGELVDVQIFSAPRHRAGELEEVILALPDVTDLKERERALEVLQETSRRLAGANLTEEVFERVTRAIENLFADPVGGCWQYDPGAEVLRGVCQTEEAEAIVGSQPTLDRDEGLAWRALESGEPEVVDDVQEEADAYNPETEIRSEIVLPLGEFGVVIVASREVDAFDEVDVEIADSLAATAETALGRVEREDDLRLFRRAAEAAGHAVVITNAENEIQYVNPAFEEITGYASEEAIGESPAILNSGEMPDEHFERMWETLDAGKVWEERIVNRRKDGEVYRAEQTIAPIRGDDGDNEGYVALQTDISDRLRLEEERKTFADIVQRLDDPIMQQDLDGNFEVLNDAVTEYADVPRDKLIGADEFAFMNERIAAKIARQKQRVIETEEPHTYEVNPTFPGKGKRSFRTTRYPHYDTDGNLDGTVAICRDVTELKERERHLQVFDRVLRHNLNNDMNVIVGHAERIRDGATGEIATAAEHIVETGTSLVDLAEKERRIVDLLTGDTDRRALDLEPILDRVRDGVADQHPMAEIALQKTEDVTVGAIPEIEDAIFEVLENAIQHANEPSPAVFLEVIETDSAVMIRIADEGPGIPEMERNVLLGEGEITPLYHGSGLGLWLVNHVVSLSGGSLEFEENQPSGSVFKIRLRKS
ncbi:MAG: PAS domain S-box protein [Halanaeroarchaeum sp.]